MEETKQETPATVEDPDEDLVLAEVEKVLKVSRKTVLRYIHEGTQTGLKLPAHKVNAYWRVRRGDLATFRARQESNR